MQRLAELSRHQDDILSRGLDYTASIVGFEYYTGSFTSSEVVQLSGIWRQYEQIRLQEKGIESIYQLDQDSELYRELSARRSAHRELLAVYLGIKKFSGERLEAALANPEPSFEQLDLLELTVAAQLGTYVPVDGTPKRYLQGNYRGNRPTEIPSNRVKGTIDAMFAANLALPNQTSELTWPQDLIVLARSERLQALCQFSLVMLGNPDITAEEFVAALPGTELNDQDKVLDRKARWELVFAQASAIEQSRRSKGQMSQTYSSRLLGPLQRAYDLWQLWSDAQVGLDRTQVGYSPVSGEDVTETSIFESAWQHSSIDQAGQEMLLHLARDLQTGDSRLSQSVLQWLAQSGTIAIMPNPVRARYNADAITARTARPMEIVGIPGSLLSLGNVSHLIDQASIFNPASSDVPNLLEKYLLMRQAEVVNPPSTLVPISNQGVTISMAARELIGRFAADLAEFASYNKSWRGNTSYAGVSLPEYKFVPNPSPNILHWDISTALG